MKNNYILRELPSSNVVRPLPRQYLTAFIIYFLLIEVIIKGFLPFNIPVIVTLSQSVLFAICIVATTSCRNIVTSKSSLNNWKEFTTYHYNRIQKRDQLNLPVKYKEIAMQIMKTKHRRLVFGPLGATVFVIADVSLGFTTQTSGFYALAVLSGLFSLGLYSSARQLVQTAESVK